MPNKWQYLGMETVWNRDNRSLIESHAQLVYWQHWPGCPSVTATFPISISCTNAVQIFQCTAFLFRCMHCYRLIVHCSLQYYFTLLCKETIPYTCNCCKHVNCTTIGIVYHSLKSCISVVQLNYRESISEIDFVTLWMQTLTAEAKHHFHNINWSTVL